MLVFLQQNPNACVHLCISLYPLPLVPKQWIQTRLLLACFYSTHHLLQDCCLCSDENASIFLPFFFIFVWREGTPGLHHSLPFLTLLFCTKNETKKLGLLKVFGCCMAQLQATFIPSTVFVQNAARSPCTQPLPTHSRHNKCWILSSGLSSYHAIREGPVPCIHILYFVSHQNK